MFQEHKKEIDWGGRKLVIETGKIARQADGAVMATYGDTKVLCTVVGESKPRQGIDFFPLAVHYQEKAFAAGKIPGGFFKREARPAEHEVLTSRVTDRPIRPLFPKGFKNETQIMITVLQSDGENMADVLAGVGASAALMTSTIPWNGPLASVRVGRIDGEFIINPTRSEIMDCDMEMLVSGNQETVVMVEGEADGATESDILDGLKRAHSVIKEIIELQNELLSEMNVVKDEVVIPEPVEALVSAVDEKIGTQVDDIVKIGDKKERSSAKDDLVSSILESFEEAYPEEGKTIKSLIDDRFKAGFREQILATGKRSDGRSTTDIRPISIDPDILTRTHGSALFTRGETQALVITTLGSKRDEMIIDSADEDYKKSYYLHYNFPPYCVGETGRIGFTSRREIGHGNLAQRAIKPVLPDYDDFPYTIRIVSEIMESNGSSSMASVCGGSLSLMSAGAPLKGHVAGIAMGLITDGKRHAILSDILGMEDHLGDMDFKVAGTKDGITALQMDIKITSITKEIMEKALAQALDGRIKILSEMDKAITSSRKELNSNAPQIEVIKNFLSISFRNLLNPRDWFN